MPRISTEKKFKIQKKAIKPRQQQQTRKTPAFIKKFISTYIDNINQIKTTLFDQQFNGTMEALIEKVFTHASTMEVELTYKNTAANRQNIGLVLHGMLQRDSTFREVMASAGSKVLITGAYLIIDPANEGIVLSTDAKFYTSVKEI